MTDEETLISKTWTSYKVEYDGVDVTSSSNTITYTFHDNDFLEIYDYGRPKLATNGNIGRWSLSGSILDLGNSGTWVIQKITKTEFVFRHPELDFIVLTID